MTTMGLEHFSEFHKCSVILNKKKKVFFFHEIRSHILLKMKLSIFLRRIKLKDYLGRANIGLKFRMFRIEYSD